MPAEKNIKWGGDEAPVENWSLGWCRANSETDPLRSVFLAPEKGIRHKWLLLKPKSRKLRDERENFSHIIYPGIGG
jgi:hypothetical protein